MGYFLEEELMMLIPGLLSGIPTGLFSMASYILTALAIYSISRRRGLQKAWLAWVPVVNCWLLGSISDHYQYVVKHKVTKRRSIQLILNVILMAISLAIGIFVAVAVTFESNALAIALVVVAYFVVLCLSIAVMVISYICYYDLFQSCKPESTVLFLILGVLFRVTLPFFVFACSKHDKGMPVKRAPRSVEQIPCEPETEGSEAAAVEEVPAEEEIPVVEAEPVEESE